MGYIMCQSGVYFSNYHPIQFILTHSTRSILCGINLEIVPFNINPNLYPALHTQALTSSTHNYRSRYMFTDLPSLL